jgi:uncharacterized protein (TIRG00374 family)
MKKNRKLLEVLLRFGLTLLVMGALLQIVQIREVLNVLIGADLFWLLLVYVLVSVRRIFEAVQLSFIFHYLGHSIGWFRVFRANALGQFYGMFTPGAIASVAKWADLTGVTGSAAAVINAVVYHRFLLDLQPITIGAFILMWENPTGEPLLVAAACVLAVFALMLAFCLYSPRFSLLLLEKVHVRIVSVSKKIGTPLGNVITKLRVVQEFPFFRHVKLSLFSFLSFSMGIGVRISIMKALGFNVPITTIVWVDAILIVTNHLPITVSNFGIREGLAVVAFGMYGVPYEQAFAYGLLIYSCRVFIAVIGGLHQMVLVLGLGKYKGFSIKRS